MAGFQDIDTSLVLQGETTAFRHFLMGAVDSTGNCLLCDADYTLTGVPIIIFPTAHEALALKHTREFNKLILKEYSMAPLPLHIL